MAVATTPSIQFFREPGEFGACTKRISNSLALNLISQNGRVPVSVFPHSMTRTSKRRRIVSCTLGRSINCGGFFDTCRYCGNQIFRKAQSRPRICLQCEKKRATPIHDRCKDCQEPIIRSNVRKARICQKCKKAREKPNCTSQSFSANSGISINSAWDSQIFSNTLLQGNCFSLPNMTRQSDSRGLYSLNHWFHRMSKHMTFQHHVYPHQQQQQDQTSVSTVEESNGRHRLVSSHLLSFLQSPSPLMYFAPCYNSDVVNRAAAQSDIAPRSLSFQERCNAYAAPSYVLPKIKTEYFETPEDIVAYLRDRVLDKLTGFSDPYLSVKPSTCLYRSPSMSCNDLKQSNEPILIPQVNPYQITQTASETGSTSPSINQGIVAEIDSSTFDLLDDEDDLDTSKQELCHSPQPQSAFLLNMAFDNADEDDDDDNFTEKKLSLKRKECFCGSSQSESSVAGEHDARNRRTKDIILFSDTQYNDLCPQLSAHHTPTCTTCDSSIALPKENMFGTLSEEVKNSLTSETLQNDSSSPNTSVPVSSMSTESNFSSLTGLLHPDIRSTFDCSSETSLSPSKSFQKQSYASK